MTLISVMSFLALTFGVPYCDRRRARLAETRYSEAAIDNAFEVEIIHNDVTDKHQVLEKSQLIPEDDGGEGEECEDDYVMSMEGEEESKERRTFSV